MKAQGPGKSDLTAASSDGEEEESNEDEAENRKVLRYAKFTGAEVVISKAAFGKNRGPKEDDLKELSKSLNTSIKRIRASTPFFTSKTIQPFLT